MIIKFFLTCFSQERLASKWWHSTPHSNSQRWDDTLNFKNDKNMLATQIQNKCCFHLMSLTTKLFKWKRDYCQYTTQPLPKTDKLLWAAGCHFWVAHDCWGITISNSQVNRQYADGIPVRTCELPLFCCYGIPSRKPILFIFFSL